MCSSKPRNWASWVRACKFRPTALGSCRRWAWSEALKTCVSQAQGKEIRMWNTGQRWKLFDLGEDCLARFGAPYWMVHRGDLHRVLVEAFNARSDRPIRLNARVVAAHSTDSEVSFELNDGSQHSADGLLAADGVHSVLREQLLGEDKAQFTGLLAWRGLVPVERLSAHLQAQVGTNWVGPGAHVITYPVRGGATDERGGHHRARRLAQRILDRARYPRRAAARLWPLACRCVRVDVGHRATFQMGLAGPRPANRLGARGSVCWGDAAHPTLPFLAQGANMAIEDAAVMARCLALDASPAQAFVRFEKLRWQRTADIVNRSRDNAQRFHNPQLSDPAKAVDYVSSEWEPEKVRRRYDWMFEYDPMKVPL
jgi:salicylate hydroxylase